MNPANSRGESLLKVEDFDRKYGKPVEDTGLAAAIGSWLRKRRTKCTCRRLLLSNFPIFRSLRRYRPLRDLPRDVISGLTVGVTHIPQGMAFSALATLPPTVGLYVSFVAAIVYFFIGCSRQASFGVIAVVALMMGSVLDREVLPNANVAGCQLASNVVNCTMTSDDDYYDRKIRVATAVSFICGLFLLMIGELELTVGQIALGKLGFGFVTIYMPDALIRGFTTGTATHVVISQTSNVLGITIPRHSGPLKAMLAVIDIFKHLPDTNWVPLVLSLVSMVILYLVKVQINERFNKKLKIPIPIELLVMIASIAVSKYCDLHDDHSLHIVGTISAGIPTPRFPDLSLARSSITDSLVIGVVSFAQSIALAKTFAIKNGYKIEANQEMFAYGVCSAVSSLFSGVVASASMSLSTVQDGTGGVSQIASLVSCTVVLMVIMFLGPLFYHLPFCILSSVIIVNLRGIFRQFLLLKPYWKQSKPDMILFLATYLAVVVIDVDIGLGVGVAVAVFSVVVRTQWASFAELGAVDDLDVYKPVTLYSKTFTSSTTRVLKFSSPLYFANVEIFQNRIFKLLGIDVGRLKKQKLGSSTVAPLSNANGTNTENTPENGAIGNEAWSTTSPSNLRHVILDLSGTTFIDIMGATTLKKVILDLKFVDIHVYIVGLPETSYHVLKSTDVWKKCSDHFYLTLNDVISDLNTISIHL